jgi:ABC-type bacteriocin/lantibiotic exporter with double-glycine peptidase domain
MMNANAFQHKRFIRLAGLLAILALFGGGILFALNLQTPVFLGRDGVVMQKSQNDCGVASMKNVLHHFGKPDTDVDTLFSPNENGVNLLEIKQALISRGLTANGYKTVMNEITSLPFPMIAHINKNHFVVIESADDKTVQIIDPSVGRMRYPKGAFEDKWDGVVLCVEQP